MKVQKSFGFSLLILVLFPWFSQAQEKITFAGIDSLSYKAYLAGDWKNVQQEAGT